MRASRLFVSGLVALVAVFSIVGMAFPAAATPTVCGGSITPPALSTSVGPGSTTVQSWGFAWTGVTPSSSITIGISSSNAAWTVKVSPTSVPSGSGSGSTTLTVTVTAPAGESSTQVTVTTSNGSCAITQFASGSEIFTGVPQFGLPAVAVVSLTFLGLVLYRKRMSPALR